MLAASTNRATKSVESPTSVTAVGVGNKRHIFYWHFAPGGVRSVVMGMTVVSACMFVCMNVWPSASGLTGPVLLMTSMCSMGVWLMIAGNGYSNSLAIEACRSRG